MTRKWHIVNDQSNVNFYAGNEIIFNRKKKKKKSNPCRYNNASILVRDGITVLAASVSQVAFKN